MGELGNINSDEFETIVELILCVLFMAFGAWAMSRMVANLSYRTEVSNGPDKVSVTSANHYAEDPFYFTGYEAYMFGWHMDELSYEDLYYIGGRVDENPSPKTDGADEKHVKLSVLEDGEVMNQFYTWRNQMITGVGHGQNRSVKKTIASVVPSSSLANLYRGSYNTTDSSGRNGPLRFHLELTDKYTIGNENGNDPNTGGKKFKWILVPRVKK